MVRDLKTKSTDNILKSFAAVGCKQWSGYLVTEWNQDKKEWRTFYMHSLGNLLQLQNFKYYIIHTLYCK